MDLAEGKSKADCKKEGALIDPKYKTFIEEKGGALSDKELDYSEMTLTCLYGLGRGAYLSVRDLLSIVPQLMQGAGNLVKGTARLVKSSVTDRSWIKNSIHNSLDFTAGLYKTSKEKAKKLFTDLSDSTTEAYKQAGVGGVISALAVETYEHSPHVVLKQALSSFGKSAYKFIENEWGAFQCMSPQAKSQMLCTVLSYATADILTGKVIWGNLAKSEKILSAIQNVKNKYTKATTSRNFGQARFFLV